MTRDVVRVTTGLGLSMLQEMQVLMWEMRWFIALCVVLIIVDLVFGIENATAHHEIIRRSRAIRRTANKFIDYMCWLLFAGVFSQAFAQPFGVSATTVTAAVMLVACISEVDSILQNYTEAHGRERFSLTRFFINFLKRNNAAVGGAIEDTIKEKENDTERAEEQ